VATVRRPSRATPAGVVPAPATIVAPSSLETFIWIDLLIRRLHLLEAMMRGGAKGVATGV
jgi:hypothetical protein